MIKTIIFDFGNVLIDLDVDTCVKRLMDICGLDETGFRERFTPVLLKYEQGQIGDENMIWHFQQCNQEINPREIVKAWNSMLLTIDKSVPVMLDELKTEYHLHLLSNINGFHARWIDRYLSKELNKPDFLTSYFGQVFYSHEIHMRKPQRRIYDYVTKQINVADLSEVLFIDDKLENVEAAQAYGWNAIQHDPKLRIADKISDYLQQQ